MLDGQMDESIARYFYYEATAKKDLSHVIYVFLNRSGSETHAIVSCTTHIAFGIVNNRKTLPGVN